MASDFGAERCAPVGVVGKLAGEVGFFVVNHLQSFLGSSFSFLLAAII
jgi:hypothetical protein